MEKIKTASEVLFENNINIGEIDDNFNTNLLNSMERYAEQFKAEQSTDEQDENWEEAACHISTMRASLFNPMGIVRELQKYFIITRKKI